MHRIRKQLFIRSTEPLTQSLMFARFPQVSRRKSIGKVLLISIKASRDEKTMTEGQGHQSSKSCGEIMNEASAST